MSQSPEILLPHPSLRAFVSHYWRGLDNSAPTFPVIPDGAVDVVIRRSGQAMAAWVYGTSTRRTEVPLEPGAHYLGIRFRPGAGRHCLAGPARELTDGAGPAGDVLRFALDGLGDGIDAPAIGARMDARLREYLGRVDAGRSGLDAAVDRILAARGEISIEDVALQVGHSRRHLERTFLDHVGVTPKFFARIVRFRRAVRLIRDGVRTLADAAADAGYADQSHMARDFRALGGVPPGRFGSGDVAFVQEP